MSVVFRKEIERLLEVRSSGPCAVVTICTPVLIE